MSNRKAILALLGGLALFAGLEFRWTSRLSPFSVALEIVSIALIAFGATRLAAGLPRARAIAGAVLLPIVMLIAFGLIVPVHLNTRVDTEYWMGVALHDAFARGAHFGSDVVFTYGPWGFVLLPVFHAKTVALMFVLRAIIAVVGLAALWKLAGHRGTAILLIGVLAVMAHICGNVSDVLSEVIPLFVLFYGFRRERDPRIYLPLIAAGGLLSLAKFSVFVMMAMAIAVVTVEELRRRARPWSIVWYAIAIAAFWLLAGQRAADFVPFLRTSIELAAGYGEAMARDASEYSPHTLVPFIVSVIAFTIALAIFESRRGALLVAGWTAIALLLLKSGFVRADMLHAAPSCGVLLVIELTYLAVRARGRAAIAFVIPIALWLYPIEGYENGGIAHDLAGTVTASATDIGKMIRWPRLREEMRRMHAQAIAVTPIPPPHLRADFYPMPNGILGRPGFLYQPRPLFVSYAVYTPRLLELNASWLRSTPPPNVLFDVYTIDRRLPSLQDGMSWPILLTRYSMAGRVGNNVLLARRAPPSAATLMPIVMRRARFGEKVAVPADDHLTFARLTIDLTRGGRLASMLYKVPQLRIRVGLDDGTEKDFRYVRAIGEREFLLSPLVEDPDAFASLFTRDTSGWRRVVWFSIEPKTATSAYEESYRVELLRL